MEIFITTAIPAVFGAAVQELLYWYNLRGQLTAQRYQRLIRSSTYWWITGGMILAAGVFATFWFWAPTEPRISLGFGVTFPLFLKEMQRARSQKPTQLGGTEVPDRRPSMSTTPKEDYFTPWH